MRGRDQGTHLDFPGVIGDDQAQEDDGGQTNKAFQGQREHGILQEKQRESANEHPMLLRGQAKGEAGGAKQGLSPAPPGSRVGHKGSPSQGWAQGQRSCWREKGAEH